MSTIADVKSHQPGMCWCGNEHKWHQLGMCWCGFEHVVPDVMLERARDLFLFNPKTTTEEVAHQLFEEFHELAKRDHVTDEYLREMTIEHAMLVARVRALVFELRAKREKEGKLPPLPQAGSV